MSWSESWRAGQDGTQSHLSSQHPRGGQGEPPLQDVHLGAPQEQWTPPTHHHPFTARPSQGPHNLWSPSQWGPSFLHTIFPVATHLRMPASLLAKMAAGRTLENQAVSTSALARPSQRVNPASYPTTPWQGLLPCHCTGPPESRLLGHC